MLSNALTVLMDISSIRQKDWLHWQSESTVIKRFIHYYKLYKNCLTDFTSGWIGMALSSFAFPDGESVIDIVPFKSLQQSLWGRATVHML